jgi:hypothetical protein
VSRARVVVHRLDNQLVTLERVRHGALVVAREAVLEGTALLLARPDVSAPVELRHAHR